MRPRCRQVLHPAQSRDSEIDRLTAHQDGFDDIGGEERQRQRAADVGPMDAVPLCKFVHRLCVTGLQFRAPPVCIRDQAKKLRVWCGRRCRSTCNDELHLDAAPANLKGNIQRIGFDRMVELVRILLSLTAMCVANCEMGLHLHAIDMDGELSLLDHDAVEDGEQQGPLLGGRHSW